MRFHRHWAYLKTTNQQFCIPKAKGTLSHPNIVRSYTHKPNTPRIPRTQYKSLNTRGRRIRSAARALSFRCKPSNEATALLRLCLRPYTLALSPMISAFLCVLYPTNIRYSSLNGFGFISRPSDAPARRRATRFLCPHTYKRLLFRLCTF